MTTTYLLIDFLNPAGTFTMTTNIDKVKANLDKVIPLKEAVEKRRKESTAEALSVATVFGRWIISYQGNVKDENETMLYIFEFDADISKYEAEIFSGKAVQRFNDIRKQYKPAYKSSMNTVELSFAKPYEIVVKPNLFTCVEDSIVLHKAKTLGLFPTVQTAVFDPNDRATIADENEEIDGKWIKHVYAFMRFAKTENEPVGYSYLRIYDAQHNMHLVDDFMKALDTAGIRFDSGMLMERFDNTKLN